MNTLIIKTNNSIIEEVTKVLSVQGHSLFYMEEPRKEDNNSLATFFNAITEKKLMW